MSDVDEIKSKLNIVDLVGAKVQLKKAGRNFKALCPFHSEKTPSFIVSPDRQSWHCFGCAKGGSVIDFVMEYEHVDFLEALETLAEKAGVKLEHRAGDTPEAKLKQKIYEVNHLAGEFYHYLLTKHRLGEKARIYLKNRGVSDKSIHTFALGYSPNGWEGLYNFLQKKGYDDQIMEKAGLVLRTMNQGTRTKNLYYDRFRGRVMFALKDHRGNVIGFAGRLLDPEAKEAKYINTSETPVYIKSNVLYGLDVTRDAIVKSGEAVIMEGELDVISSFQEGIGNAVAIKGSALTEGHVHLLRRYCERILFALDSDVAGDAASRRGIETADRAGLDMKVVMLPKGKDPDDLARGAPALLKIAIKDAIPVYDYFLSSARQRFDTATAFGKRKITDEIIPVIAKIENAVVQSHYMKKLAVELDIPEETIADAVNIAKARQTKGMVIKNEPVPAADTKTRLENIEHYLLALLLQGETGELFEEFKDEFSILDLGSPLVRQVMGKLAVFLEKNKIFLLKDFVDSLAPELLPTVDEALLADLSAIADNEEAMAKTWLVTLRELHKEHIRQKIGVLTRHLKDKGEGKEDELVKIQEDLVGLTRELSQIEKKAV